MCQERSWRPIVKGPIRSLGLILDRQDAKQGNTDELDLHFTKITFSGDFQVEMLKGNWKYSLKLKGRQLKDGKYSMTSNVCENVWVFEMEMLKLFKLQTDLPIRQREAETHVSNQSLKFCQSSNNSVSYFLNNLDSSHDSYYSCRLSIFDPPPHQVKFKSEYLHIYESQLCCQLKFWLPIGCAAFGVIYIFGCTFLCWFKNKKHRASVHDANSEYMFMAAVNTAKKPRLTGIATFRALGREELSS
ncbi:hypothetical protein QTO34_002605 [Cnephaeus nilssonii]|uniref:Inducible T-cell costimulator n=1 Tax=Cnephaeus nilssonii TaxID=3371016 RepID=A0AA40LLJ3_CNENI|nr:hypothetical protein QTO34_002605 [Eptesicus nilssonii]